MAAESKSTAEQFARYQGSIASHLRYEQAQRNLEALHDLDRPVQVLDAAGGNGLNTEFLLRRGHSVTLLDTDPDMLEQARERLGGLDLLQRCELVQGDLESVGEKLSHDRYDLILCHHVLEYTNESPRILKGFADVTRNPAQLSLITLNPVSETVRAAVFRRDAALARKKLTDFRYDAKWFGQAMLYPFEQILEWAEAAGWTLRDFRGIRVLADYIPEQEARPQRDEVLALEEDLAGRDPYRRFGRYFQFCFAKQG